MEQSDNINIGDTVRMRYMSFWMKKSGGRTGPPYTEEPALVIERVNYNSIRVLFSDGTIKRDLSEYWEALNEAR